MLLELVVENTKEESDNSKQKHQEWLFLVYPQVGVVHTHLRTPRAEPLGPLPQRTSLFLGSSLAEPKRIRYTVLLCCPSGMIWPFFLRNPAGLTLSPALSVFLKLHDTALYLTL